MKTALIALFAFCMLGIFAEDSSAQVNSQNNRPQFSVPVSLSADKKLPVLVAHKKLIVRNAKLVSVGAISASGSNYLGVKLQKSTASGATPADVSGNAVVDTQLGVAAYGHLSLDLTPAITLEKGEALYLDADVTGTLSVDAWLSLDVQVVGS